MEKRTWSYTRERLPPNKPYNKKQELRSRTFSPKQGTKDKATTGVGLPKGRGEVEPNSPSQSVHSIHPNTNKPNTTKVKKTNTKTHTNTISTNQPTKPSHSPTTPNPRCDTPREKGVGERGRQREGKHYSERYTDLCSDKCQKFM